MFPTIFNKLKLLWVNCCGEKGKESIRKRELEEYQSQIASRNYKGIKTKK